MSNNIKLNKALNGLLRDHRIRNFDKFNVENSVRPNRAMYWERYRSSLRKLGFDDYHILYFLSLPLCLVLLYQGVSFYLIFGEKPIFTTQGLYKSYHAAHFFYPAKTNPDVHYNKLDEFFTGDRLSGLRTLPKRPWEAFKDPENTMKRVAYKHNRNNPEF